MYSSRIWSFVSARSILSASSTSANLREYDWRRLRKKLRATCWVLVEQVGDEGARDALDAHAGVGIEVRVLGGQQRVAQDLREVVDRHEAAPLGAELRELEPV